MADIILPNEHKLWVRGVSLSVYSRSYDFYARKQDFTDIGRTIHEFKYYKNLDGARKFDAIAFCERKLIDFYRLDQDESEIFFDTCIAVPSNNAAGISLPSAVVKNLERRFSWLQNASELLFKTREVPVIKDIGDPRTRIDLLKGAYSVSLSPSILNSKGILIIDDIYDSGATVREVARTLKKIYPNVPRYVFTFAHLKSLWG